jgi:pyruvate formate lyase activating enzyme
MSPSAAESAPAEALLWARQPDGSVVCDLCAHRCRIKPGLRGICGVRENREGALVSCRLAAEAGLRDVFVTNGYMTPEALALIAPVLHAANVDLKSFSDRYDRKVCGATLRPVLDTIRGMRERGIWVEVTTLLIPGHNDDEAELAALTRWFAERDRDMPWHVSAFSPPTPLATLERAARIGREAGLRYVYAGNIPDEERESTACPGCGDMVVRRHGFAVLANRLEEGRCPGCRTAVAGVWA